MQPVPTDVERFAYDIFRINWIKCNVPRRDILFRQNAENGYSRSFIRSIAKYVMFYQVLIRNDIKIVLEKDLLNLDDEFKMFEFFNSFMPVNKDLFIPQVMHNVGCSLAMCLELSLYKYPVHRRLLRQMSGRWQIYFQQFLQLDFYLNGGFEGLHKHAESMHNTDYTRDKFIYESNRRIRSGIWKTSHVSIHLEEDVIKIDKIRKSTISVLNYCTRSENSRFLRMLYRSEMLPVVGKMIKWTRLRIGRIRSRLFCRRSSHDRSSLESSSESSAEGGENGSEDNKKIAYSMIGNYIQTVQEYYREESDINCGEFCSVQKNI